MDQDDSRRASGRQDVQNDNSGSQQSCYREEPFVLANDVAQVFYVKDMSTKPKKRKNMQTTNTSDDEPKRHLVLSGKRNIVGVEDKTDMLEDYVSFMKFLPSM